MEIPNGWSVTALGSIATSAGGGTPSKADPALWSGGTIPWVSPKDMKSLEISSSSDLVTTLAAEKLTLVPAESVLVVVRSGILARTLPVGITRIPVTINQDMRAFIPKVGISPRFIALQLVAKEHDVLTGCAKNGTTVASIEGPAFASFPIWLAPEDEQTRIVTKLEELLSDLDTGVAELKAAQKKLAQYRQSLLKAAVEGRLTAEWRKANAPTEIGADFLARILKERRARWEAKQLAKFKEQGKTPPKGWQASYPEPVAPDTADLPALPEGWVWASVDQLSPDDLANGRSVPSAASGAKVLRLTALKEGCVDLNEYKLGAWTAADATPFAVTEGDLLIARGNGSLKLVGRAGLVPEVRELVAYPDTMIRLRLLDSIVSSHWISLLWDGSRVRSHIEKCARTSAGIYKISQPDIVSAVVPVPPLEEQVQILQIQGRSREDLGRLTREIERALKQSTAQRKNILRAAFAGQLVPQDPNDEPASVLLDRIRASRVVNTKPPAARKQRLVRGES